MKSIPSVPCPAGLVSALDSYLDKEDRRYIHDEVDNLTETGRRLLREAPEFRKLVMHIQSLEKGDRTDNAPGTW